MAGRKRMPPKNRQKPIRAFAQTLEGAAQVGSASGGAGSKDGAGDVSDTVTRGVRNAYQVIDEYMERGREVARSLGIQPFDPIPADRRDALSNRWVNASAELASVWVELAMAVGNGVGPVAAGGNAGASNVRVEYEVQSGSPKLAASLQHEFLPGRETTALASHGLRRLESPDKVVEISFSKGQSEGSVLASVQIGARQAPGLYTGALLDEKTGDVVGSLSLRLRRS